MLRETATAALERALHGLALRQEALADNIANAETPGHGRHQVVFEDALRRALAHEHRTGRSPVQAGQELDQVRARVVSHPAPPGRGVVTNLEAEMTDLALTSAHHEAVARALTKRLRMLRTAITGGV